jgi:hypothetical protein
VAPIVIGWCGRKGQARVFAARHALALEYFLNFPSIVSAELS